MKRRIIGLLLVVVMMTLTLAGCGYSFAKDDMTQYTAEFDKDAFQAALQDLKIAETGDGAFTTNEDTREIKVLDKIYKALAKAVDAEQKLIEGTPGQYDVLYYVYFCTGVKDGVTYTFYADKMKESGASSIQLGLSDHSDLNAKIAEAIAALGDIDSYVYKTTTTGNTEAGETVYLSYTRKYSVPAAEGDGTEAKTETYKYVKLELGKKDGTSFIDKLVDKEINQEFDLDAAITEKIGDADVAVNYSDIKIHWVVDEGANIPEIKYTPGSSTPVAPAEPYIDSATSNKIELKDVELTYYVFPVYYKEVAEFNAVTVLKDVFGSSLSTSSLPMFSTPEYKPFIEDLAKLLDELVELEKAVTKAEDNLEKKQKAVDDAGENVTDAQKTARDEAKTALEAAKLDVEKKNTAIDNKIDAIFNVDKDTDGEDDLDTKGNIEKEYWDSCYKDLETKYNNFIKYSLATEIYNLIEEIKVNSLPKKAVDDAYDALMDSYKETFYTGTNDKNESHYSAHKGDFKSFLMEETGATDYKGAKEKVREEAEAAVKPMVQIYAAAQALDLVYTDKEYDENVKNTNLGTYEDFYGELNIKLSEQIDKILDHYLEMDEEYLVEVESDHDDHEGHDHEVEKKPKYKDGKIVYVRIQYSIKDDATETE